MLLGTDVITVSAPDFATVQLPMLQAMRAGIARIRVAPGFGIPTHVASLLASIGVHTVVLNIENTDANGSMPAKTKRDLFDRGWLAACQGLITVVEFGNEPNNPDYGAHAGDPTAQVNDVLASAGLVHDRAFIAAGMPTTLAYAQAMKPAFLVCDALCPHLYGGTHLGDGAAGEQAAVLNWTVDNTSVPLYLTEIGIADGSVPMAARAGTMLSDLAKLNTARIAGACIFTISTDGAWHQPNADYWLTMDACHVLGARSTAWPSGSPAVPPVPQASLDSARPPAPKPVKAYFAPVQAFVNQSDRTFYPQTGHSLALGFKAYWESHGGLAMFGYPISEEFVDPSTGLTTQYFERAVFEYHPNNAPDWQVELRLLGRDDAKAKGYV